MCGAINIFRNRLTARDVVCVLTGDDLSPKPAGARVISRATGHHEHILPVSQSERLEVRRYPWAWERLTEADVRQSQGGKGAFGRGVCVWWTA